MKISAVELLRKREDIYKKLGLAKKDLSEKLNNRIFGSKITSNDINKLNKIRSTQNFELTEKEKYILKLKETKQKEDEKKRRLYLRQQDLLIQENYNKFNKLITKK